MMMKFVYGCFSFCFLVCKSNILSNRTNIFRDKTSFCQFLTWLLPGLKKMLILKTICSNQEMLLKEEQRLFQALKKCKYPTWALKRAKLRCQNPSNNQKNNNQRKQNNKFKKNLYMVVPYYKGLSESITRSCNKCGYRCILRED